MIKPVNKSAQASQQRCEDPMCDVCYFCDANGVGKDYCVGCDTLDWCIFTDT